MDASGAAYVAGETDSPNFPVQNAAQATHGSPTLGTDAFVAKLNPAGSALVYSTFLGGTNEDTAYGIAVDAQGNAYVTGETHAPNFPTLNAFQSQFGCPDGGFGATPRRGSPTPL